MIRATFIAATVGWLLQALILAREGWVKRDGLPAFCAFMTLGWAVAFARELGFLPRPPTTWLLGAAVVLAWLGVYFLLRLMALRPLGGVLALLRWRE